MRDSEVVASIVARKPEGLAAAYDRYAAALYTYCRSITADPADAADAVQDTFVLAASRIDTLRDPDKLRSWLYAIARNECLRLLRDKKHTQATDEVPEVTDAGVDLSADAERAEKVALVQQALDGLNPGEREVIELQLRHELEPAEMADVLGVSRNHVHSLLSRARQQLEACLAVLLVGRLGKEECRELSQLLADWDGQLTVLLRKRVSRHIEQCGTCTGRRAVVLTPAALLDLSGAMALAFVAAPATLKDQVLRLGLGQEAAAAAHRAAVAKSAGAFRDNGFPRPAHGAKGAVHHAPWHASRQGQAAIAAAVVVVAALAVALALTADNGGHHRVSTSGRKPPAFSVAPTSAPSTGGPHKKAPPAARGGHTATPPAGTPVPQVTSAAGAPHPRTPRPTTPGGAPGAPPGPGAPTSPGTPTTPGSPVTSGSPSPTPTPTTATSAPAPPPLAGTLTAAPAGGVLLLGPKGVAITLRAVGGPVSWSVTQVGLINGSVTISPSSGTLGAGQQATVTVTAGLLAVGDVLSVSPCGHTYILVLGSSELLDARSPSVTTDAPPSAAAGVQPPASGVISVVDSILTSSAGRGGSP
ncbi:MAG TPA: sigma-70 family RNA polymerase sigma factor [Trebonia sp.]|nr:sigma-70 family RNA polymerase sigma factor [Trebonia sp.]